MFFLSVRNLLLVVQFEAHLISAVGVVLALVADLALVTHFNQRIYNQSITNMPQFHRVFWII